VRRLKIAPRGLRRQALTGTIGAAETRLRTGQGGLDMDMKTPATEDVAVTNGAEAFLEQVRASGHVRYIFGNLGTDHGPIIEAMAKQQGGSDGPGPQMLAVPHEQVAMSMAMGYFHVARKMQMVMVHTLPGTANALGGVMNACSANSPVMLVAGRTPATEGEEDGGRSRPIHWRQESFDQGAMVREWCKWDFENRANANLGTTVPRAFKIAMTEPRGPVYMVLPREWLVAPLETTKVNRAAYAPPSNPQADEGELTRLAEALIAAENPLIVTKFVGRNPEAVPPLVALAEKLAVPVVCPRSPGYMNFPTDHDMFLGDAALKHAKDADVILFMDVDVPWPKVSRDLLRSDAQIFQLELDPNFTQIPVWGFPVDHAISGSSTTSLPVLNRIADRLLKDADGKAIEKRRKATAAKHKAMVDETAARVAKVRGEKPMHPLWVSHCVGALMDGNTVMVDETTTSPLHEVTPMTTPGCYIGNPPAGHLGYAMGAALGAKLAAPEKTVICAIGDGAYMFGIPTATHFVSRKYSAPVLFVVFNNQAWNATISTVREFYEDGVAASTHNFPGCDLGPSPDFEMICQSCGGYAERVDDPADLPAALQRGLRAVREEGRQALINVVMRQPL
jgi:acetolactate synthase-1/2/3 large subunit